MDPILTKVNLYTTDGVLAIRAYSLPFKFWPQMLVCGNRTFVRDDWRTNPHCEQSEPPKYYEITGAAAYTGTDLAECGIV